MPSIVTKTGDDGTTALIGGARVGKHHPRTEAYGTIDELNALIGIVLSEEDYLPLALFSPLLRIQHTLFRVGAALANPGRVQAVPGVTQLHVDALEAWIAELEPLLPVQRAFLLPGGSALGAALHHARTVCRRAERRIVALQHSGAPIPELLMTYINRLGDFLFIAARICTLLQKQEEIEVRYDL
jgi:cob(I)alamin adenosyltransferase